jgi:quinol monooxygenase YgiN
MAFIQIIDSVTSKMDQIEALAEEMRAESAGTSTAQQVTITKDRDRDGHFLVIAEFASYESAMENSNNPATQAFAAKMAALCDGPPTFYNLDVIRVDTPAIDLRGGQKAATT